MTYENAARGALEELGDMSLNDLSLLGHTEQRMLLELCHHWSELIERRHQREAEVVPVVHRPHSRDG